MTTTELDQLLTGLRPAELALRDWLRDRLDPPAVLAMARLDHGMRADEHRRGIEELLTAGRLPEELDWTPREVLELAAHGEPGLERLFACMVLVRTGDVVVPAGMLAGLVESALKLGPSAAAEAARFLAWCRLNESGGRGEGTDARPFLTLGLLLLSPAARDLTGVFLNDVEAVREWPGQPVADALRAIAGGAAWQIWRRLVDGSPVPV